MDRLIYVAAAYAASVGLLCAQQPATATPAAPAEAAQPAEAPKAPARAEATRSSKSGNGGGERGSRREGEQGAKQGLPTAFMERLRQEHPELHKRLTKLYQEDRETFFQEVRALMRERGVQTPEGEGTTTRAPHDSSEERKCAELSRLYQASQDPAEKERLKAELAAAIQAAFEARLRGSQERIARLEQQLKEFRGRLGRMEANRDKICAERLEDLTEPAELRWGEKW
jgi:hypothetical protein